MELTFNSDGTFRIAQLTDIHLNHYPFDENDQDILNDIETHVNKLKPDLIMITGDIVNTRNNAREKELFATFFEFLNNFHVPKAITYGNHDSENQLGRLEIDAMFHSIVTHRVPRKHEQEFSQLINYAIEVMHPDTHEVKQVYYVLDTGHHHPSETSTNDWLLPEQVDWFKETAELYKALKNNLVFIHIPIPEYVRAKDNVIAGELREPNQLISASRINTGLFSQLYLSKQIHSVYCGHNHLNNAVMTWEGIHLSYGLFSGKEEKAGNFRGIRYIDMRSFAGQVLTDCYFYQ